MKQVYESNPALGDPMSIQGQLTDNGQRLDKLRAEQKKYQVIQWNNALFVSDKTQHFLLQHIQLRKFIKQQIIISYTYFNVCNIRKNYFFLGYAGRRCKYFYLYWGWFYY